MTPWPKFENRLTPSGPIGTFGCAAGRGRVVKVEHRGEGKPPRRMTVRCPACGEEHEVAISWRKPSEFDVGREPDLILSDKVADAAA